MLFVVSGASGFIGRAVCKKLLEDPEIKIIALSRSNSNHIDHPRIEYFKYELGDSIGELLLNVRVDSLIHLAWEGLPNYNSDIHVQQLPLHEKFIAEIIDGGCRNLYIAGTCFEYKKLEGIVGEDSEIEPSTNYGIAKVKLHENLINLSKDKPVNLVWMRLFYIFGKDQSENTLVGSLLKSISSKLETFEVECKKNELDYLEVNELASRIYELSMFGNARGVINVAAGYPTQVGLLVEKIAQASNSKIKITEKRQSPTVSFFANVDRYRSILRKT